MMVAYQRRVTHCSSRGKNALPAQYTPGSVNLVPTVPWRGQVTLRQKASCAVSRGRATRKDNVFLARDTGEDQT